jgi:porin
MLIVSEERGQSSWAESLAAIKTGLDEKGIHSALIYDGEVFADVSGGQRRGVTYLGNLDLQLTLDLSQLIAWPGATIFIDGLNIHGGQPSQFAGDAQGVSSIAAPNKWTLEEAWIQQDFGRFSILFGRYDLNSEFDRLHGADLFFNSSFGINAAFAQTGKGGPSIFPNTSVGTRVEFKPLDSVILRVAVLDGVPVERPTGWDVFAEGDGLLIVSEVAFLYRPPTGKQPPPEPRGILIGRSAGLPPYEAKFAVGTWQYTASFPDLSEHHADETPVLHHGNVGGYVIGETVFYRDEIGREMRVFGELSVADERINRFDLFLAGGVVAKGFVPNRSDDEIGFGFVAARNGDHYLDAEKESHSRANEQEVTLEIPYLAPITSWLSVEPDVQFVINPNTDPHRPNALVGLLRVELSF